MGEELKIFREAMNILYWGTYDRTKPRNQILLSGLRESGHALEECHFTVWSKENDKSQLGGILPKLILIARYLIAYPVLIFRYLFTCKNHDVVVVGYLGIIDAILLWPFAKIKNKPIVLDAFLSVYNTAVEDRQLLGEKQPFAKLLFHIERLSYQLASLVIIDTNEHAKYIIDKFSLDLAKVAVVLVGTRKEYFKSRTLSSPPANKPLNIIFYGTMVPLQGVCTVFEAAKITPTEIANWTIIGRGQGSERLDLLCEEAKLPNLKRIEWLELPELQKILDSSDLALGIFGDTAKASRVIPIKFYEAFAMGLPIITMDTPAIRELVPDKTNGLWLVPPADPKALSEAVIEAHRVLPDLDGQVLYGELKKDIFPLNIAKQLIDTIEKQLLLQEIPHERSSNLRTKP